MIRSVFILISILLFGNAFAQVTGHKFTASKATEGTGLHKETVWWISWDINADGLIGDNLEKGVSGTFTSPSGYIYNITLSEVQIYEIVSGVPHLRENEKLNSDKTTSWSGNSFPYGYKFDPAIKDVFSISNSINGHRANFKLKIEGKAPNRSVFETPKGIVIAGSESLAATEYYTLSSATGKIKVIDKYIHNNAWNSLNLTLESSSEGKTLKAIGGGDYMGDVMLYAEDTSEVSVELKGNGLQTIALGFIEELDYNDNLSATYGDAWHVMDTNFTSTYPANGITTVSKTTNKDDTTLIAKVVESNKYMKLGQEISSDNGPNRETLTNRTDLNSNLNNIGDRDDDVPETFNKINQSFPLRYTNETAQIGHINIWVDADKDGVFEPSENYTFLVNELLKKANNTLTVDEIKLKDKYLNYLKYITNTDCNSSFPDYKTVYRLTTCPYTNDQFYNIDLKIFNLTPGQEYEMRVRLSSVENLAATGYAPDGEVEDHHITILAIPNDITGTVFLDDNANIPDGVPLKDIDVTLRNTTLNTIVDTKKTATDGSFLFTQIPTGNYEVVVTSPIGKHHVSSTDAISPIDGKTNVIIGTSNVGNIDFGVYDEVCHKPARMDASINNTTKHGITSLITTTRNIPDKQTTGQWPIIHKGAWTSLESKSKGFVLNRVAAEPAASGGQVPQITKPVLGMVIYDTTNDCIKIYDGTTWKCFNKQSCPIYN